MLGLSMLAGIGITVSLLIGELAYDADSGLGDTVRIGVLTGSLLAAFLATIVLRVRNRHYRRISAEEQRDDDGDGVPDIHQTSTERPPVSGPAGSGEPDYTRDR